MTTILNNTTQLLVGVFGLVIVLIAVKVAAGAKKAQYADTARISVNTVAAMVFLAIGLGAISFGAFGGKILAALGIS